MAMKVTEVMATDVVRVTDLNVGVGRSSFAVSVGTSNLRSLGYVHVNFIEVT